MRLALFPGAAHHRPSVRLGTRGPIGLDYVAGAITGFNVSGRPRALVLVVNRRPRGSLAPDLARITLTVSAPRRLGRPLPQVFANPFTRPSGLAPAICDLPIRGAALAPGELRSLLARGSALPGFSAQAALAQAYKPGLPPAIRPCIRAGRDPGLGCSLRSGRSGRPVLPAERDLLAAAVPALPPVRAGAMPSGPGARASGRDPLPAPEPSDRLSPVARRGEPRGAERRGTRVLRTPCPQETSQDP